MNPFAFCLSFSIGYFDFIDNMNVGLPLEGLFRFKKGNMKVEFH